MRITAFGAALDWLGRQGMRAVALSVFIAMAVPALSAVARPLVAPAIFLMLVMAFLKLEATAARAILARPARLALATGWTMLVLPALVGKPLALLVGAEIPPGLLLGIAMMLASAPVMSSPAFAGLLGLETSACLALLVASLALMPVTAPLMAAWIAGQSIAIDSGALALRLALLVGGAALVAAFLRRVIGPARLAAASRRIDGLNVLLLFVFAVAIFDGVAARLWAEPGYVLGVIALSFALAGLQVALTVAVAARLMPGDALATAIAAGHRNMGVMAAAATGTLPTETWLWFALAQFPIYLLPYLLTPFARRRLAD